MIAYEIGSSTAMVYIRVKTRWRNFKHGWQNDMDLNMATLSIRGVHMRSSFLGNLKPSDKKSGLHRTPTWGFSFNS